MTKDERSYLEKIVADNLRSMKEVVSGEKFSTIFKTDLERQIFMQGMNYANEPLEGFMSRGKAK